MTCHLALVLAVASATAAASFGAGALEASPQQPYVEQAEGAPFLEVDAETVQKHLVRAEPHRRWKADASGETTPVELEPDFDETHNLLRESSSALEFPPARVYVDSEIGADGEVRFEVPRSPQAAREDINQHRQVEMPRHADLSRQTHPTNTMARIPGSAVTPLPSLPISADSGSHSSSPHSFATAMLSFPAGFAASSLAYLGEHVARLSTRANTAVVIVLCFLIILVWAALIAVALTFLKGTRMESEIRDSLMRATTFGEDIDPGHLAGHEGQTFRDVYEVGDKLGDGAFGVVYEVTEISTGKELAVKMIDMAQSDYEEVMMELRMLRRVHHEYLTVSCVDEFMDPCFYYIVMPKYSGGDLLDNLSIYMEERGLLPESIFTRIFEQMVAAVEFVHSRKVVHRDIKPDNYLSSNGNLCDPENRVVLTDFGLSVAFKEGMPLLDEQSGTPIFWCPEMLGDHCAYGFGCDIWAVGLTAYVLLEGGHAFHSIAEIERWKESSRPAPIPKRASESTAEMLELALDRDPQERSTAPQLYALARGHPLLREALAARGSIDMEAVDDAEAKIPFQSMNLQRAVANMDEAKLQRREKMIHTLNMEHGKEHKKRTSIVTGKGKVAFELGGPRPSVKGHANKAAEFRLKLFGGEAFAIKKDKNEMRLFDWWTKDKCLAEGLKAAADEGPGLLKRRGSELAMAGPAKTEDIAYMKMILSKNKVDLRQWGSDPDATIQSLAKECHTGAAVLAEEDKKVIRVVDVVVPVLSSPSGDLLVQVTEKKRPDGTHADKVTEMPGKKRLAAEHTNGAALRALAPLGITKEHIVFIDEREVIIQKEESKSFPGVMTVYRRHMVAAQFASEIHEGRLKEKGWPEGPPLLKEDADRRVTFTWITKQAAQDQNLFAKGDPGLAARYNALVPARTSHTSAMDLREKFKRCDMDPSEFGDEKFEELAIEEEQGESTIVEEDLGNGKRTISRVVRLTVVRVLNSKGNLLIEVGSAWRGKVAPGKKMPGIKQRLHENPFLAARRYLTSRLMLDDDEVHFDVKAGGTIEEIADSKQFPGLKSVYEKQVIVARVTSDRTIVEMPTGDAVEEGSVAGSDTDQDSKHSKDGEDLDV